MAQTAELTEAGAAAARGSEATVLKTVQSLGAVVGPSALITALLFYFGWAKTAAFCNYFGLNVSLLGLSTQDYLLQSIHSVFIPLGEALIAGLLLLRVHRLISLHLELRPDRPMWKWVTGLLVVSGVTAFAIGLAKYADPYPEDAVRILTPLSMMLGVGIFSYALLVDQRRRRTLSAAPRAPSASQGVPGLSVILVSMLIAIGLVWVVANYADIKGQQEARFVYGQLHFQPGVVVYSVKRLQIAATGVHETKFPEPDSAYGFRYDGLKLLFHSNGRYFLIPEMWSPSDGTTIVLRDNDSMRLEFLHYRTG
ncbi:MAG: hypothetical protein M3083_00360 [Actinomycetota bacterium]|nr:hypothetical protein [Actinomycetota bacterium]MDQ6948212.1 hypothetical protein [Actinomycetota bacterium]